MAEERNVVELEDLIAETVLLFCENLAELGCPKHKEADMWFRELSDGERYYVAGKMLDIEDRNAKRFEDTYDLRSGESPE